MLGLRKIKYWLIAMLTIIPLMGCEDNRREDKKSDRADYPDATVVWDGAKTPLEDEEVMDMSSFSPYLYEKGVYYPSESYKGLCGGANMPEKLFLRSWVDETYLWYDEVPDIDPEGYLVSDYFDLLKTSSVTDSGNLKDRYHWWITNKEYENTLAGVSVDYGLVLKEGLRVAYSQSNSSAYRAGIQRGWLLVGIDGKGLDEFSEEALIDILFKPSKGESHAFNFFKANSYDLSKVNQELEYYFDLNLREAANSIIQQTTYTAKLVANSYQTNSVYLGVTHRIDDKTRIGHLLLNDFQGTAERDLKFAISQFKKDRITDLVLDLRYNGGGQVAIASQLAYMISGKEGETFAFLRYNDKTQDEIVPVYGLTKSGDPLPTLGLDKVVVIVTEDTASASELLINGLLGLGVEVSIVGTRTYGKPHGYTAEKNCGSVYFSVQFESVNAAYNGGYDDGFTSDVASSYYPYSRAIQGCYAYDDLGYNFGREGDLLFNVASIYAQIGVCAGVRMPRSGGIDHEQLLYQHPLKSSAIAM